MILGNSGNAGRGEAMVKVGGLMINRARQLDDATDPDQTDAAAPLEALTGSLREYRDPHGADLFARVEDFYRWQDVRRQHGYWPYSKSIEDAPKPFCAARDDAGRSLHGVNFASQDYLSLASHPGIKEAAVLAI